MTIEADFEESDHFVCLVSILADQAADESGRLVNVAQCRGHQLLPNRIHVVAHKLHHLVYSACVGR